MLFTEINASAAAAITSEAVIGGGGHRPPRVCIPPFSSHIFDIGLYNEKKLTFIPYTLYRAAAATYTETPP